MATVAFVLTSHDAIGANGESTGVWLEELATPYYRLREAGHTVTLTSITGGTVAVSPQSLRPPAGAVGSVQRWLRDETATEALATTTRSDTLVSASIDALVIPGGHGALWDLANNAAVSALVESSLSAGKVVAAICHGPAALIGARQASGEPWVSGRRVATFTVAEEQAAGLAGDIPLLLETRLRELGADIVSAPPFTACAVRDGTLVTAQNPASADAFADHIVAALVD
ncbi:MAG: type 1 glutamine amidotransferase domain-containing protein [Pseudomonadota bacterium]